MVDIKDFKYHIVCDFDNHNIAKHSIGMENAPAALRVNICTQCLIDIITEGLRRLTDEERADILKEYIPETENPDNGQDSEQQEYTSDSLEQDLSNESGNEEQFIVEEENKAQKLDKASEEEEPYNPIGKPREELIEKAKSLGVEGKYATFTNKMLENEIIKKLGGK